jgi:GT2 family glycosyltransferase
MKKNQKIQSEPISILMTVFNGEVYLKAALDSLINQTYSDSCTCSWNIKVPIRPTTTAKPNAITGKNTTDIIITSLNRPLFIKLFIYHLGLTR